jgi:hypothetical protein
MLVCFVFCLMAQIAVHSAAQFFRFYFVLFEFCLAITFLGIFIVVISPKPQVSCHKLLILSETSTPPIILAVLYLMFPIRCLI